MRVRVLMVFLLAFSCTVFGQDISREYFGTVFLTQINDNNVNVRELPGLDHRVVTQLNRGDKVVVTGMSALRQNIDRIDGYWLRIGKIDQKDSWNTPLGWVFSKYVDFKQSLNVSVMKFEKFTPATAQDGPIMKVQITRGTQTTEVSVYPDRLPDQDYYTFTWSDCDQAFFYTDCPGTYVWYPGTSKIKRITYRGYDAESAWVHFDATFSYMFQDFGTSPGPRGLSVINLATNREVYSGSYYQDIHLRGDTIETVVTCDDWHIQNGYADKESIAHVRAFEKTHTVTPRTDGLGNTPLAVYRLNFRTGVRTFLRCEWIVTQ